MSDSSIDDMEMKLICLRLLRYITCKDTLPDLEEKDDPQYWLELKERQVIFLLFNICEFELNDKYVSQ